MLANFPEPPSSQVKLGGDARQLFQPMKSTKARAVWNDFCESVPWQIHWGSGCQNPGRSVCISSKAIFGYTPVVTYMYVLCIYILYNIFLHVFT